MNEYQNAGENCAFLQCGPCRRYLYSGISQDIRSSSSHMYYYIVVLKNLANLTGMHLHQSLFSTCNLELHWKRDTGIYRFQWVLQNFLGTLLLCKLGSKGELYEKWRTNILIMIKIYREVHSSFKKTDIVRENVYLRTIDRKLTLNLIVVFNSFTDIFKVC